MVALTADRNTPSYLGDQRQAPLAAAVKVFAGSILMRNAAGFLTKGATATGSFGVGVAMEQVDNSAGIAGAKSVTYEAGVWRFANSSAGDLIAQANIGAKCWIVDDQTVALTNGTNTRSPAGIIENVDALGVWVRFDEALNRAT